MSKKEVKSILSRIKTLLGVATDREMCEKLGWKYSTLDTWKNRGQIPQTRLIEAANALGVSVEKITEDDELVVKSDMVSIPIVSESASAGGGSNVESVDVFDTHETLVVDRSLFKTPPSGKLHAIKVNGYSMVPMLLPDSWVIFEESEIWSGDGLYVLIFRNVLMVKLVEADPKSGSLWIKSANPDYDSWEYDPTQDQSTMKLVGKVLRCVV